MDKRRIEVIHWMTKKRMLAHEDNYAVIVVTHNEGVAAAADVVYGMLDGALSAVRE